MTLKKFLKPDWRKIVVFVVLAIFSLSLFFYSMMIIDCLNPPCKDKFMESLGIVINIVPFMFSYFLINFEFPFPIDLIFVIIFYFIIPLLWYYLLSCLIVWIYDKFRKR